MTIKNKTSDPVTQRNATDP